MYCTGYIPTGRYSSKLPPGFREGRIEELLLVQQFSSFTILPLFYADNVQSCTSTELSSGHLAQSSMSNSYDGVFSSLHNTVEMVFQDQSTVRPMITNLIPIDQ